MTEPRKITADDWMFPPNHNLGEGDEFFVHLETKFYDCIAVIMTAHSELYSDEPAWLYWTEGLNEWCEEFPTFSTALARMAALAACGESDWVKGFTHEPDEFATLWSKGEMV